MWKSKCCLASSLEVGTVHDAADDDHVRIERFRASARLRVNDMASTEAVTSGCRLQEVIIISRGSLCAAGNQTVSRVQRRMESTIGALIITHTILGVPYYNDSIMRPPNPIIRIINL